jgi:hypothetical protein
MSTIEIRTETQTGTTEVYRLDETALEITRGTAANERHLLADVAEVQLASLGQMRICSLRLRTNVETAISTRAPTADFTSFVGALHDRLVASGAAIRYVHGGWLLVGVYVAITTFVLGSGFALYAEWITVPDFLRGKGALAQVLAVVYIAAGPLLVRSAWPRPYDPTTTQALTR